MQNRDGLDCNVALSAAEPMSGCVEPPAVDGEVAGLEFSKASQHLYKMFQGVPVLCLSVFFFAFRQVTTSIGGNALV